jgi:chemotaxis protein CheX
MNVAYVNPFIRATVKVFRVMLGCELADPELRPKRDRQPTQDVSGIIEITGPVTGVVVLGVSRSAAIRATEVLLNEKVDSVNELVRDAVGELTNMIAGNAKAELDSMQLRVGLPWVVVGRHHTLPVPRGVSSFDILFHSAWGPVVVGVSLAPVGELVGTAA